MKKLLFLLLGMVVFLTACSFGSTKENEEASQAVGQYYEFLLTKEYSNAVKLVSEDLLSLLQLDEQSFVESFEQLGHEVEEYTIMDGTALIEETVHQRAYEDNSNIKDLMKKYDSIYRVRVDILYEDQNSSPYPGIDDALLTKIDGEWKIIGIFSY